MSAHFTTRYRMCVTAVDSMTLVASSLRKPGQVLHPNIRVKQPPTAEGDVSQHRARCCNETPNPVSQAGQQRLEGNL